MNVPSSMVTSSIFRKFNSDRIKICAGNRRLSGYATLVNPRASADGGRCCFSGKKFNMPSLCTGTYSKLLLNVCHSDFHSTGVFEHVYLFCPLFEFTKFIIPYPQTINHVKLNIIWDMALKILCNISKSILTNEPTIVILIK